MKHTYLLALAAALGSSLAAQAEAMKPSAAAAEIDSVLAQDWQANKLKGNPAVDDNTFVRRLYLDIIGRIPTTREADAFLADSSADKRAKLIDKLLNSEGYVQHYYNYWADVLRLTSNGQQTGNVTGSAYMTFVKDSLRANKPYDEFVRDMVAAQGKAWENGAIGYYMRDRGMPLDNMANTVRVFLGTRIECAQCHNHPFDKWSQMQFYQMASYTYGVQTQDYNGGVLGEMRDMLRTQERAKIDSVPEPKRPQRPDQPRIKGKMTEEEKQVVMASYKDAQKKYEEAYKSFEVAQKDARAKRQTLQQELRKEQRSYQESTRDIQDTMRYTSVSFQDERQPSLPHDYQYKDAQPKSRVAPAVMMGHTCEVKPGETQLQAYARWMTSPQNPRFTTVITNRLWKRAFGLANIEPLDELMDTSTPFVPALQTQLEKLMVELNYDMKGFLRVLFNTRSYQSQVTKEEVSPGVAYHFTGPLLRRMTPEQMWDSFVTLINPTPEMVNTKAREDMEQRVLQAKKNADSLDALGVDALMEGVKKAAAIYEKNEQRTQGAQAKYAEARNVAKAALAKAEAMKEGPERDAAMQAAKSARAESDKIRSDVSRIQNEGRQVTYKEVLVEGSKKLFEKVTGKPYAVAATVSSTGDAAGGSSMMMSGGAEMMSMNGGARMERVRVPGYDRKELTKEERQAQEDERNKTFEEEAAFYGITNPKDLRRYIDSRRNVAQRYLRSAELESPAPRGHYLREFGQSDREVIENANNEASVPQALAMMNGELLPQMTSSYSQLMLTISKAPYPDDKVDAAYMTLLSRKPTPAEKKVWLDAQEKGLTDMNDLIFSLLNTQQFIFVQ
jgi:hypothetical protein